MLNGRRLVDFRRYQQDMLVVVLASIGLYDHAISEITGLTISQIQYRLRVAGASQDRRMYRAGTSPNASSIVNMVTGHKSFVHRNVVSKLKKQNLL